jgi:hypothetical protein
MVWLRDTTRTGRLAWSQMMIYGTKFLVLFPVAREGEAAVL